MRDVSYMVLKFNTRPNSPSWNPNADVDGDLVVNMRDIQIAILHFNEREPASTLAWWNKDWPYRKSHIIQSAPDAGTDYQIKIVVNNASGIDGGETVFLANKSREDFGDIRFVADDGKTNLSYYIETLDPGKSATFWVKLSSDLSASDATIWMYYGNSAAVSESSGLNTFPVFDDFEGASVDISQWTITGNVQTSDEHAFSGSKCMEHLAGDSRITLKSMPFTSNFKVCAWFIDTLSSSKLSTRLAVYGDTRAIFDGLDADVDDGYYLYRIDGKYYNTYLQRTAAAHKMEIAFTDEISFMIDGVLQPTTSQSFQARTIDIGSPWISNTGIGYWDTIFIRKCVSNEPVQGTWGNEQMI